MAAPAGIAGGRLIARNTLLNLLGYGLPALVALAGIPVLIRELGTERFGVLTLAWMAIGYFSLFDLGLGRALTQLVAERLGTGRESEIPTLTWTALALMGALALIGSLLLALLAPWLAHGVLNIPPGLQAETISASYLLAFSLPWVISTAGLRGVLEAQQRFGMVNALRVPMGVFTFAGPLLVLPFSASLVPVVAVLMLGRVAAWLAHLWACLRSLPALRHSVRLDGTAVRPLLRFGGWMTVTNVVSPLMTYMDRFLIGALLSVAAVAYYVTPYEVVTRVWLLPAAVAGVLFPAFASSYAADPSHTRALLDRGLKLILVLVFPFSLLFVTLAYDGLQLWLGAEFAGQSTRVLQWLAVGLLINSLGQIPFTLIQGAGAPDVTAKLHLAELPLYLLALWALTRAFGIEGAAAAWTGRVAIDTLVLLLLSQRRLGVAGVPGTRRLVAIAAVSLLLLGIGSVLPGLTQRLIYLATALPGFALLAWFQLLSPGERKFALGLLRRFGPARSRPSLAAPTEALDR